MAFGLLGIHRMDALREEGRQNAEKAWREMEHIPPGEPPAATAAPALEAQAALERQKAKMRSLMEDDLADLRRQAK